MLKVLKEEELISAALMSDIQYTLPAVNHSGLQPNPFHLVT